MRSIDELLQAEATEDPVEPVEPLTIDGLNEALKEIRRREMCLVVDPEHADAAGAAEKVAAAVGVDLEVVFNRLCPPGAAYLIDKELRDKITVPKFTDPKPEGVLGR